MTQQTVFKAERVSVGSQDDGVEQDVRVEKTQVRHSPEGMKLGIGGPTWI